MFATLVLKTWRDRWRGLLAWTLGIAAMAGVELMVYPTVRETSSEMATFIENFPEVFQGMFTLEDYTTGPGFLNVELFSIMVPLVMIAVAVSWGAGATADEERNGTADILLSLPVSRSLVIVAKMVAAMGGLAAVAIVLATAIALVAPLVDISLSFGTLIVACLASALLGMLFGSLAFLLGAITGRRSIAMGVAIAVAIAGFLVKSLASVVETFDAINPYNPFEWVLAGNPLADGLAYGSIGWLALGSAVLLAAAVVAFGRRDISA